MSEGESILNQGEAESAGVPAPEAAPPQIPAGSDPQYWVDVRKPGWKSRAMARWKLEGRWWTIKDWMDRTRKKNKLNGDKVWEMAVAQYPPVEVEGLPTPGAAETTGVVVKSKGKATIEPVVVVPKVPRGFKFPDVPLDTMRDVIWVYENMTAFRAGNLGPEHAPSSGAWGLMEWANKNWTKFYSEQVQKLLKQQIAQEEERGKDDGRDLLRLLERTVEELVSVASNRARMVLESTA